MYKVAMDILMNSMLMLHRLLGGWLVDWLVGWAVSQLSGGLVSA